MEWLQGDEVESFLLLPVYFPHLSLFSFWSQLVSGNIYKSRPAASCIFSGLAELRDIWEKVSWRIFLARKAIKAVAKHAQHYFDVIMLCLYLVNEVVFTSLNSVSMAAWSCIQCLMQAISEYDFDHF